MGHALLLQRCRLVELVLQLPLRSAYLRYDDSKRPQCALTLVCVDLKGVDKMSFKFDLARPFRPFEQLMGVLPEASRALIPAPYRVRRLYNSGVSSLTESVS